MSGQFAWNLGCPLHQPATGRLGARRRIVFKANCTQFLWAEGRKTNDPPTVDRQVQQLFGFLFLRPRASKTSWKRQRTRVAKLSLPGPTTATNLSWEQGVTKPQQRGVERRNFACTCAATALQRRTRTWSIDQSIDWGIVSHFTVSRASGLLETAARPGRAKIVAEISCFCAQREGRQAKSMRLRVRSAHCIL